MTAPTILERIHARKREEIAERQRITPLGLIQERIGDAPEVRGFEHAVETRIAAAEPAVIAEIKKASPSKGVLRQNFSPPDIARDYELAGAACLSVLTDADFFQGSEEYLTAARNACGLPVIRKDFLIDPYQIYESRDIGADAVLLIVASLSEPSLHELHNLAREIGLDVLIEVHNADELNVALRTPCRLIGINNRNLHNFETSLATSLRLMDRVPDDRLLITESGIHSHRDVDRMRKAGIHGFLVGEACMRQEKPGTALQALFFRQL